MESVFLFKLFQQAISEFSQCDAIHKHFMQMVWLSHYDHTAIIKEDISGLFKPEILWRIYRTQGK